MDILVYGDGVCAGHLAAALSETRQTVTLLAKGPRAAYLRANSLTVRHVRQKAWSEDNLPVTEDFPPSVWYDAVFVVLREQELPAALPALEANKKCPLYLFIGHNGNPEAVIRSFSDPSRIAFGFLECTGSIENGIVYGVHRTRMPLILGDTLGKTSHRLNGIAELFYGSFVKPRITPDIGAFLKRRMALGCTYGAALHRAGYEPEKLAQDPEALRLLAEAMREGESVLEALGVPSPPYFGAGIPNLPPQASVLLLRRAVRNGSLATLSVGTGPGAQPEIKLLTREYRRLLADSGVSAPACEQLLAAETNG